MKLISRILTISKQDVKGCGDESCLGMAVDGARESWKAKVVAWDSSERSPLVSGILGVRRS